MQGSSSTSGYHTQPAGEADTLEYRVFFDKDGTRISPFHDIPLVVDAEKGIYNVVIEIPRNTKAKLEINKSEAFNPIKQDVKAGKLRYVEYGGGYMWNYGAFPQTWEDPNFKHPETDAFGDADPLDVCEIGEAVATVGQVKQVKVLGVMALIDEGETDWKVIVIDVNDPLADKLNDIDDVEKFKPEYLHKTYVWFRDYKGAPNTFAFEGKAKDRAYALKVIQENHEFWEKLVAGQTPAQGAKYNISLQSASKKE
jgi:inorganic pyrophosphatase